MLSLHMQSCEGHTVSAAGMQSARGTAAASDPKWYISLNAKVFKTPPGVFGHVVSHSLGVKNAIAVAHRMITFGGLLFSSYRQLLHPLLPKHYLLLSPFTTCAGIFSS